MSVLTERTLCLLAVLALMFAGPTACKDPEPDDDDDTAGADDDDDDDDNGDDDVDPFVEITENNQFPSVMPPGDLDPQDAPQILVFGFDDCMFTGDHWNDTAQANNNGMNFIEQLFGPLTNPDGSAAHVSFYVNGAYLPNTEVGGPWGSETDYTVQASIDFLSEGFELGNHTFDHLETNSSWGQVPAQWSGAAGGWETAVGTLLDEATWLDPVITANDQILTSTLGVSQLYGMRAPRLEINDAGLKAAKSHGYLYDCNLEDGHQWEYVSAAVDTEADATGFKWVPWPYSLNNGSPGVWQTQDFGEKDYLGEFAPDLWEIPVYMAYVPDNGLQEIIAERMKAEITSEDMSWVGDKVREMTSYDFNAFIYARLTKDEFLEIMKHTFLTRYNGNRAPLTIGGHPAEFSWRYDNEVILGQENNWDYVDVLDYNTYQDRKDAYTEFVQWVVTNYGDEVYFMSNKELVEYMKAPFDKNGNAVGADTMAEPANTRLFNLVSEWTVEKDDLGSDATYTITGGASMDISFTIGNNNEAQGDYCWTDIAAYFNTGALAGVSHIDVLYEAEAPFRLRLIPDDGVSTDAAMQVLVAGVGGERTARIRMKDFRPDPYEDPAVIAAQGFVDDAYMQNVNGLSIESASTHDQTTFAVNIKKIVLHGLDDADIEAASAPGQPLE